MDKVKGGANEQKGSHCAFCEKKCKAFCEWTREESEQDPSPLQTLPLTSVVAEDHSSM